MSVLNKIFLPEVILRYNGGGHGQNIRGNRFICPFCLGLSASRPHNPPEKCMGIKSGKAGYPTYGCFRCHKHGNALTMIEDREGLTGEEPKVIIEKAKELGFLSDDNTFRNRNLNINPSDEIERINVVKNLYEKSLENKDNRNIVRMLQRRKISEHVISSLYGRVGYDPEDESVVFPIVAPSGGVVAIHKIKAEEEAVFGHGNNKKNLGQTGCGFFYAGRPIDQIFPNVILVEGVIDALSVASVCPQYAVLSSIGTQHTKIKKLLDRSMRNKIIVCYDHDENQSGIKAANRIAKDIDRVKRVQYENFNTVYDDGTEKSYKDINEILMDENLIEEKKTKLIRQIMNNPMMVFGIEVKLQENGVIFMNNESYNISPFNLSKFISEDRHILSHDGSCVYVYNGKCYEEITEVHLDSIVSDILALSKFKQLYKSTIRNEFKNFLRDGTYIKNMDEREEENKRHLTLNNCLYDLNDHSVLDHTPGIFTTSCLPYDYNSQLNNLERDAPIFRQYLFSTFETNPRMIKYIQEIMGYILYKGTPRPALFICVGPPGTGKNVFIELCQDIVGDDNHCTVKPDKFHEGQWLERMHNKLLNAAGELDPNTFNSNIEILKEVSDGNIVTAKVVYQKPFQFKPYCKHIFGCNTFPSFVDQSHALYDRLYVVPFKKRFRGTDDEIVDLIKKLNDELPAIFNWMVKGLKRLIDNNFKFSVPEEAIFIKEGFKMDNDPVYNFIKTCLVDDEDSKIRTTSMLKLYENYIGDKFDRTAKRNAITLKRDMMGKGFKEPGKYLGYYYYKKVGLSRDGQEIWNVIGHGDEL